MSIQKTSNFTKAYTNGCGFGLNDLLSENRLLHEKHNISNSVFCVNTNTYWSCRLYNSPEYLVEALRQTDVSYLAIFSDEEFEMIHITNSTCIELIKECGYIKANICEDESNSFGRGIYCFDVKQNRRFDHGEFAIVMKVKAPHIRIVDYNDTIKPIGEHLILLDKLNLINHIIIEGKEAIDRYKFNNIGTFNEILRIYGLEPDLGKFTSMLDINTSNGISIYKFVDSIPFLLNKLRSGL